jgi:hypothetical protein
MTKIMVKTTVALNSDGFLGAALFVLSPFVVLGATYWLWSQQSEFARYGYLYNDYRWLAGGVSFVASGAWLAGIIKLITGREFAHEVTTVADSAPDADAPELD